MTGATKLRISVAVAAHNAEATISRAILSVLHDELVHEVVIIDDASTDRTVEVVHGIPDLHRKICLVRLQENRGPASARNKAIEIATGDVIAILDADDVFLEGRIEKLSRYFPEADFVADDLLFRHTIDGPIYARKMLGHAQTELKFNDFVLGNLSGERDKRTEFGFLKPLISRDFLMRSGLRYREELRLGEDYAFYAEALLKGARFLLVEAAGYVSLERPDSISANHRTLDLERLYHFDRYLLDELSQKEARECLLRHMADTKDRLQLRRFLDAKASRSYGEMLREFFESFRSANYISREMIRAKLGI